MKIRIVMVAAILCALTGSCTISTTTARHISSSSTTSAPRCDRSKQDCALQERITAANTYLETRPGTVGFVVRDRESGFVYRSARADEQVWTSVGFTGPDERYTLAIMNALNGEGGYDEGVETISHVARVLLARVGDY